jgi:hypothetical protein
MATFITFSALGCLAWIIGRGDEERTRTGTYGKEIKAAVEIENYRTLAIEVCLFITESDGRKALSGRSSMHLKFSKLDTEQE